MKQLVKKILLCFASAVLLILAFPPFNLWPLAWVAFVPLFLALQNTSKRAAFLLSYITGVIFWAGSAYWIIHVTLVGFIALSLYLGVYFGVFGLFYRVTRSSITSHQSPVTGLFVLPAAWVLLEYIRSHFFLGGFCWSLVAHSQSSCLPVIQIADVVGAYGVSFLVMMGNAAVFNEISTRSKNTRWAAIACILVALVYGYWKVHQNYGGEKVKIAVVQGNIPQETKYVLMENDEIIARHIILGKEAAGAKPALVIWPETAFPSVFEEEQGLQKQVRIFVREHNVSLLTGAMRRVNNRFYNSAVLFAADGAILNIYDKLHLVPFGEYLPWRKPFAFLEALAPIEDFTAGSDHTVFELPGSKVTFSVLICFEDTFPRLSPNFVKRGADFLVVITNDAWFGRTAASYQHLQSSIFRAVENRRSVVRAANTGVSGFITPTGKILSLVEDECGNQIYTSGFKSQDISIPVTKTLTPYTRFGDVLVAACLLILGVSMIRRRNYG